MNGTVINFVMGTIFVLIIAMIAPIAIYADKFGVGTWENHSDWGVMGSAFGGIYSILFSFFTVMLLLFQFAMQRNTYEHQAAMDFIATNRAEYNEVFSLLCDLLFANDSKLINLLVDITDSIPEEKLLQSDSLNAILSFNYQNPRILRLWGILQAMIIGMKHNDFHPYKHALLMTVSRTEAVLTLKVCHALDKAYYISVDGKINHSYYWEINNGTCNKTTSL